MKNLALRVIAAILTFTIGTTVAEIWRLSRCQIPEPPVLQVPGIVSVPALQVPRAVIVRPHIPAGWYRVSANGLFAFHLPTSMKVSSNETSFEARWGKHFSNAGIGLYAEYTSWPEGYAAEYLAKQFEYEKERIEISGRKAIVHTWRWAEPRSSYKYEAELRIYNTQGEMLVRMLAGCKERPDVEIAKRIFMTVQFP